jgi:AraC-like DNA-binding protein
VSYGAATVLGCGFERCGPAWSRRHFTHESYAKFYFVVGGAATYENEAGGVRLAPGTVYFFPPHQGSRHLCPRLLEVHWMHIAIDAPALDARLAGLRRIETWPAARWAAWKPVYTRLAELRKRPTDELALRVQAMILHGLAEILGRHPESEDPRAALERARFAPALALMDAQFRRAPPLAAVAAAAGLSRLYFHRSFRRLFRTTPHRYMLRRRMDLARQLLAGTTDSVGEVARQCGYDDQFYFSRAFKREAGLSPERFRGEGGRP